MGTITLVIVTAFLTLVAYGLLQALIAKLWAKWKGAK